MYYPNTHETSRPSQEELHQPIIVADFTCNFNAGDQLHYRALYLFSTPMRVPMHQLRRGTIRSWRVTRACANFRHTPFEQYRLSPNEYRRLYHRPSLLVQPRVHKRTPAEQQA